MFFYLPGALPIKSLETCQKLGATSKRTNLSLVTEGDALIRINYLSVETEQPAHHDEEGKM